MVDAFKALHPETFSSVWLALEAEAMNEVDNILETHRQQKAAREVNVRRIRGGAS